jgi:DinB family protein
MEDLKTAARLVRWTARNFAFNLQFIPQNRLDWKPAPDSKSAAAIVGEVAASFQGMLPILQGGEWQPMPPDQWPTPATVEEGQKVLLDTAEEYAAALEEAGPELQRTFQVVGADLWGPRVVLFPLVEILHHHGQIAYIQSLLGDREAHFDMEALMPYFGADPA